MKKCCPAFQGYPTCRGETTRSPELSRPPRRVRDPDVNGWLILQRNELKLTSARVTRGEGCLGYPRPYKWALNLIRIFFKCLSYLNKHNICLIFITLDRLAFDPRYFTLDPTQKPTIVIGTTCLKCF